MLQSQLRGTDLTKLGKIWATFKIIVGTIWRHIRAIPCMQAFLSCRNTTCHAVIIAIQSPQPRHDLQLFMNGSLVSLCGTRHIHCWKKLGGFRCMGLKTLYCKALCDVKFCQIEGNGRKFRHIELSNIASSVNFFNCVYCLSDGANLCHSFFASLYLPAVCIISFNFLPCCISLSSCRVYNLF